MSFDATTTLATAFGVGAIVSALSARVRFPAVLPLLAAGVVVGPSCLGLVDVASVGGAFRALVALSIGLLVFEGGLHLDRKELTRAPRAVLGLLTVGVLVTWAGAAALGVFLLGLDLPIALVLGSMLIVTGPTVIQPILRHVRLSHNLHAALSAEAILIDPIGVVMSVITMEVVMAYYGSAFEGVWEHVLQRRIMPAGGGVLVGLAAGGIGFVVMKAIASERKAHAGTLNIAATGICMLAIAAGEMIGHEGGLVAATITAIILANTRAVTSSDVRQFKEQVATLLVGMLFILLASQIDISRLRGLGAMQVAFIAAMMLLVRPLNAWLGTLRSRLTIRERMFVGLFAPRGIVAASVATLAVKQMSDGLSAAPGGANPALLAQVQSLDLIVYAVIGVSVLFSTTAASPLGRALGVMAGAPRGVMIVGAHLLGRKAARALADEGLPVVLVDVNVRNCEVAAREGLTVVRADATDSESMTDVSRDHETGWVFAWTGNDDVDRIVGRWAAGVVGPGMVSAGVPDIPPGSAPRGASADRTRLRTLDRMLHEGSVGIGVCEHGGDAVHLLALQGGRPVAADARCTGNGKGVSWLTLRTVEPAAAFPEPDEAEAP